MRDKKHEISIKKRLGFKGVYSSGRFVYSAIKSDISSGCILVLPESYKNKKLLNSHGYRFSGIYYYQDQTFGENSLFVSVQDLKEAELFFNGLSCKVGMIKDLDNKELFIIEKI